MMTSLRRPAGSQLSRTADRSCRPTSHGCEYTKRKPGLLGRQDETRPSLDVQPPEWAPSSRK